MRLTWIAVTAALASMNFGAEFFSKPAFASQEAMRPQKLHLLVRLKEGGSLESRARALPGLESFESLPLVPNLFALKFSSLSSMFSAQEALVKDSSVIYAEPSRSFQTLELDRERSFGISYGPNNPAYNPPAPGPKRPDPKRGANWNIPLNHVAEAWKFTRGAGVVVAVIDTGVDYNHEDLAANIWHNPGESGLDSNGKPKESNGIDDDSNGFVDDFMGWDFAEKDNLPWDDYGHGTHVSGIIAAAKDNGRGAEGIAPEAKIMPLRFITAGGSGSDEDAIKALAYAAANGAKVINNSWGGAQDNPALSDAFKALENSGIVIVTAAGNEGTDIGAVPVYPARYKLKNTIAVAANGTNNTITFWSCFSSIFVQNSSAGYEIFSTLPNNGYGDMSGTSMASPNMAGAVALARALRPDLSPEKIKALFHSNDMFQPQSEGRYTEWHRYSTPGVSIPWLAKHPSFGRD